MALLLPAWSSLASAPAVAAARYLDLGDQLNVVELSATNGARQMTSFERPSIIVFWSTWSPLALSTLQELVTKAPKGGVRWQVVPINIDSPDPRPADTAHIHAAARAAGWHGPVWYDHDNLLIERWGILSAPTVIITNLGGLIAELEHDWSREIQTRIFTLYFGAITDSFPGMPGPSASEQCLMAASKARRLWRLGQERAAITAMRLIVDSCQGLPCDLARYVEWVWMTGDSLGQGQALDSILERGGENPWTLALRARLAERRRDCETAARLADRALRADSMFAPAWIARAEVARACGDMPLAQDAYRRLQSLCPRDARVLALGAALAEQAGETAAAATYMRRAVEARMQLRDR